MIFKRLSLLTILFITAMPINYCSNNDWTTSHYFDTKFLGQYDKVTTSLKEDGFKEVDYTTSDGLSINGLLLERPNSIGTIILCSGWLPGRKEGIATFYAMFPSHYNLFFIDARGHGKSQGSLFFNLWQYGLHEYKDIIGAVEFIHQKNRQPIILFGLCAGAFHAAHALIKLKDRIEELNIKGLIFDSGWASLNTASLTVLLAKKQELFTKGIATLCQDNNSQAIKQNILFKLSNGIATPFVYLFHGLTVRMPFYYYDSTTNLFDKIDAIKIPILFIHSQDDEYAPIQDVIKLANSVEHKTCWWISSPSKHATHHLKHKKEYRQQCLDFFTSL